MTKIAALRTVVEELALNVFGAAFPPELPTMLFLLATDNSMAFMQVSCISSWVTMLLLPEGNKTVRIGVMLNKFCAMLETRAVPWICVRMGVQMQFREGVRDLPWW